MSNIVTFRDLVEAEASTFINGLPSAHFLGGFNLNITPEADAMRYSNVVCSIFSDKLRLHYEDSALVLPCLISRFSVTELPGNARVLISHGVEVGLHFRSLGLGEALCRWRMELAQRAGYESIACTVNGQNDIEHALLNKCKWSCNGYITPTVILYTFRFPVAA